MNEFVFLNCICTNVIDGDTLDVEIDVGFDFKTKQRLRLIGVDTPERNTKGYKQATDFTTEKCLNKPVQVTTYKRDAFGRWLSIVEVDGENLNNTLIEKGLADVYKP
ncbi:thermonuclease family protein [Peribacillus asahii]|uniref:thermonuclease family protein n=1 Tax=Peribacillus asahii TaxID=228899 RepID=UPI0020793584|nr:thermonuclease family protein [Peribacillus asahii]USK72664.1 thermonuclease family protein [Peribacillus asahii]USK72701.1 thermonuclease family protein [Peribacillus asahii]